MRNDRYSFIVSRRYVSPLDHEENWARGRLNQFEGCFGHRYVPRRGRAAINNVSTVIRFDNVCCTYVDVHGLIMEHVLVK